MQIFNDFCFEDIRRIFLPKIHIFLFYLPSFPVTIEK